MIKNGKKVTAYNLVMVLFWKVSVESKGIEKKKNKKPKTISWFIMITGTIEIRRHPAFKL